MNSPLYAIAVHSEHGQVNTCHLVLAGEFDLAAVCDLDQAVDAALEAAKHVDIDLDQTTFIDSSVIGRLVARPTKPANWGPFSSYAIRTAWCYRFWTPPACSIC